MASEVDIYGDPAQWKSVNITTDWGFEPVQQCPQCGAVVFNSYQHKAWHIQFDRTPTAAKERTEA